MLSDLKKNLAQDSILVLISEWHIFSWFLAILMIKVFLTVVNEYAKNQKNTGHFVVISISATYGEVAEKFSKNNLSLMYMVKWLQIFLKRVNLILSLEQSHQKFTFARPQLPKVECALSRPIWRSLALASTRTKSPEIYVCSTSITQTHLSANLIFAITQPSL